MTIHAGGDLTLDIDGAVATLTLNRPQARNAMNSAMWRTIPDIVKSVSDDASLRLLLVRGAGGHFASGADIAEFPTVFADREAALNYGRLVSAATGALANLGKPVIAVMEGYCIGAGLAVALACDLRIAAEDARLGAPPAKLGLLYSLIDTRRLISAIGLSAAKAMLFTGALYPATEALRLGLVDETHAPKTLEAAVAAKAQAICAASPWSIQHAKAMAALIEHGAVEETDQTRAWYADAAVGADFKEGLAAFHARRKPVFQ